MLWRFMVLTLGHRNIFGIAIDKKTGTTIIAENDPPYHDNLSPRTRQNDKLQIEFPVGVGNDRNNFLDDFLIAFCVV